MNRKVMLPDGTKTDAIGQGTWFLGEGNHSRAQEREALLAGIDAGMALIDTAEMYGEGKAEELVGETISGLPRENLFLVSKVYPHNAGRNRIFDCCEQTLRRMRTDYLDLYLLHWRGSVPLAETVACMEELVSRGKIRRWGVSNFRLHDMEELWSLPGGRHCAVNQLCYHLASRGIEYDLLPWMRSHSVPAMAYCPLAQGGELRKGLFESAAVKQVAEKHAAIIPQILLAFVIRSGDIIAIPRASRADHAIANAKASEIFLDEEDLAILNQAFPAPDHAVPLDVV